MSALAVVDQDTGELVEQHVVGIAALNEALAKAQGEFPAIKRERQVDTGSYKYNYAPLDVIFDAVRKPLTKNGLSLVQLLEGNGDGAGIRTELRHAAGGVIGSSFPLPHMPERPQELGSMLTYLRRYAVMAILGIATEEDDDGQAAQNAAPKSAQKMSTPQRNKIFALIKDLDTLNAKPWPPHADWKAAIEARCHELYSKGMKDLTKDEASQVIEAMSAHVKAVMDNPEKPEVESGTQEPLVPIEEEIPF